MVVDQLEVACRDRVTDVEQSVVCVTKQGITSVLLESCAWFDGRTAHITGWSPATWISEDAPEGRSGACDGCAFVVERI